MEDLIIMDNSLPPKIRQKIRALCRNIPAQQRQQAALSLANNVKQRLSSAPSELPLSSAMITR
ncbi:hypothetical protein [Dongshaea marina]|uniref:hypothetical protein n=1 Tax=Dongshaea marina TaxID=2047966 RepID=UPI00131F23AA|nr:hypothetical protein [Dongshaea marina]